MKHGSKWCILHNAKSANKQIYAISAKDAQML